MAKASNKASTRDQNKQESKNSAPKKENKKKGKEAVEKASPAEGVQNLQQFVKDSWSEFRKIQWPTPRQVTNESIVVLVTVVFMIVLVNFYDFICNYFLSFILQK